MPRYCSIEGCNSRQGPGGRICFRFPRDEIRCQRWKDILRFVGTHKYANLTVDQCYERLAVCDLHFRNNDFLENSLRPGLKYNAIPSLNLGYQTNMDVSTQTDCAILEDACLQSEFNFDHKKCSDASSQSGTYRLNNMATCGAMDCKHNNLGNTCTFFRLPIEPVLRAEWLRSLRRDPNTVPKVMFVCSCHFRDGKKENGPDIYLVNENFDVGEFDLNYSKLAKLRAAAATDQGPEQPSTSAASNVDYKFETKSDVPIEHVDVGSVSTISCEEHSDSNLDFLPESEQPPIPTFPSIPSAPKDMKSYCRLCLNPVTKVQMICLGDFHDINYPSRTVQFKRNKILQTEMYLRMIKDLMPNFNHDLVFNPVMCNDCSTRLQMASDFVEQCMATQKLIQQFKDTHCPLEGMVSCEDVVYNKSLLQASSEEGPSQPKQRKISSKPSTSKSVAKSKTTVKPSPPVEQPIETGTFPPDEESQPSSEDVNIKMESIDEEEMEFEDKYEISQDEICYVKQEVAEEAPRIKTDVPIKTEPEFPLLPTNSIVKREPYSSVTSDSTVMTDLNSVKRFSTSDVSSDVDQSSSSVHAIDLPLSSDTLISNYCPDIQGVIAPETCISAVNPSAFSSVNSQFENGQNR